MKAKGSFPLFQTPAMEETRDRTDLCIRRLAERPEVALGS